MGNSLSNNSSINNVYEPNNTQLIEDTQQTLIEAVDQIATGYILKQNMIDIMRFTDKDYRQNLILLTSHILKSKLSSVDLGILKERVLEGTSAYKQKNMSKSTNISLNADNSSADNSSADNSSADNVNTNNIEDTSYENENNNTYSKNMDDNLVYISNKEQMLKYSIETDREKKKAIVVISKFYVKIMILFSAIVSVVDPQYVYETEDNEKKYFYLKDYDNIKMMGRTNKTLRLFSLDNPMNLVKRRLLILKNKMDHETNNGETSESMVVINPGEKICKMNLSEENGSRSPLTSEIGIKELDMLYYDVFDEETNTWSKRSKEMDELYKKDVLTFFQIFSGKKDKPANIQTFEDIELLDFHNLKRCKNGDFFEDLLVSKNDVLFRKYLTKIEEIQEITKTQKRKLLFILKSIFHERPKGEGEEQFKINPELKMKHLEEKQRQIKECILKIYTLCEQKFIEALIIYERMYDNQHGAVVENRLNDVNENWSSNSIEQLKQMELNRQDLRNMKDNENSQTVLNNALLQESKIPIYPKKVTPLVKPEPPSEPNTNSSENNPNPDSSDDVTNNQVSTTTTTDSLNIEGSTSSGRAYYNLENSLHGAEASTPQRVDTQFTQESESPSVMTSAAYPPGPSAPLVETPIMTPAQLMQTPVTPSAPLVQTPVMQTPSQSLLTPSAPPQPIQSPASLTPPSLTPSAFAPSPLPSPASPTPSAPPQPIQSPASPTPSAPPQPIQPPAPLTPPAFAQGQQENTEVTGQEGEVNKTPQSESTGGTNA